MNRLARAAVVATLAAPLLSACSTDDEGLTIVTSFYPWQFVAERIAGDHAEILTLTQPGQEPHDLELTVRQTASVAGAELVLYQSGLQPAVDEAVDSTATGAVVDAMAVIEDKATDGGLQATQPIADNPHIWLDPHTLQEVAPIVADELATIDPDNAADYREAAAVLVSDLVGVDGKTSVGLETCDRRTVVVSHDAFAYYGARYDLEFAPIAGLSPDAEPSPKRLAELERLIDDTGVTTVFYETLASPAIAETLAAEVGVKTAVLDPIEGLSDETADEDYLSLMLANLAELRAANECR